MKVVPLKLTCGDVSYQLEKVFHLGYTYIKTGEIFVPWDNGKLGHSTSEDLMKEYRKVKRETKIDNLFDDGRDISK